MTTQFQLQVQLQSSGEVSIFYGEGATNNGTFNYASGRGIVGVTPGGGITLPAVSDLSVVSTTVDDTLFEEWTVQTTFDMPLQKLLLIPSAPGWTNIATPLAGCATATAYGTGCISAQESYFEVMPAAAVDLAGSTTTMLRSANEYVITNGVAGAIVAPTGSAQVVANGDDVEQTVALASPMPVPGGTTSSITICSNGRIALAAAGNGARFAPDIGNFLNFAQTTVAAAWHDYNPALAGSGSILFEQAAGFAYVTWDNVYTYGTAVPDRFQYQFELATGNITVVYDTFGGAGPNYLIGYSRGGNSLRPEMSDISVALAAGMEIADADVAGLTLAANGLPLLGNPTFAIDTSNVPNVAPVGVLLVGDTQTPPLDLAIIGMPGCRAYSNANLTAVTFSVTLPQGAGSVAFAIPTNPALIGATLVMQSAAFTLATPLNLVASNGLRVEFGV